MRPVLLLLFGPSGVGKTEVIRVLCAGDRRFRYVSPFVTRPLRVGETDKVSATSEQLASLWAAGDLLVINELYGVKYGTPRRPIDEALRAGQFPVLDWPVSRVDIMTLAFGDAVHGVYLEPPDLNTLRSRLSGRDGSDERFAAAVEELEQLKAGAFDSFIQCRFISGSNDIAGVARAVRRHCLDASERA